MSLTTYVNTADNNVLDKYSYLTSVSSSVSIELKKDTDLLHPVLELSTANGDGWNYCYISEFDRYYYVAERTFSQQKYIVKLDVDPLYSFCSEIKSLNVIANRSSSRFNVYQPDDSIPFQQDSIVTAESFPNGFSNQCFILAVNGG